MQRHPLSWRSRAARAVSLFLVASLAAPALMAGNADAFGDSRTLTFFHTHTQESATVTFRRGDSYVPDGLRQLNHLLRDWRVEQSTSMDPRLFDIIWEVHQAVGSRGPVHIISAYRAPETNKALRNRSRAVSEHSQHMLGRAMDVRFPDVDAERVREAAMRLQHGGVGFYPGSNFVHVDVASVRAWPRMSREQLARLFPDGKTVHLPSNGNALPGYEQARAEILSRGSMVAGLSSVSVESGPQRRSLWASLFGGGERHTPLPATAEQVLPPQVLAYVPLPPRRPEAAEAPPGVRRSGVVPETDLASLRVLFSKARLAGGTAATAGVVMAKVNARPFPAGDAVTASGPGLVLRFGDVPGSYLKPETFAGSAVSPVPILLASR